MDKELADLEKELIDYARQELNELPSETKNEGILKLVEAIVELDHIRRFE
jgi:hypothetical protein